MSAVLIAVLQTTLVLSGQYQPLHCDKVTTWHIGASQPTVANCEGQRIEIKADGMNYSGGVYVPVTLADQDIGKRLRVSAQAHIHSTNDDSPISSRPARRVFTRLGIDPDDRGMAEPASGRVRWSEQHKQLDVTLWMSQELVVESLQVGLYLQAYFDTPVRKNRIIWEKIEFNILEENKEPKINELPPMTHTLQAGETLYHIALMYNIEISKIISINKKDRFFAGDVIKLAEEKNDIYREENTSNSYQRLCMIAFIDKNRNLIRDEIEELVGGVRIRVKHETSEKIYTYVTTGYDEPHCWWLSSGEYIVMVDTPAFYNLISDKENKIKIINKDINYYAAFELDEDALNAFIDMTYSKKDSKLSRPNWSIFIMALCVLVIPILRHIKKADILKRLMMCALSRIRYRV